MAPQEFQTLNPVCDHASLDWLHAVVIFFFFFYLHEKKKKLSGKNFLTGPTVTEFLTSRGDYSIRKGVK